MSVSNLSQCDVILLAARDLQRAQGNRFSTEALVVAAWERAPEAFGLAGFLDRFPSSNRVIACLSSRQGPVARGMLNRVAPGEYALSAAGHQVADRLLGVELTGARTVEVSLPVELDRLARHLLKASAVRLFDAGRRGDVGSSQATDFWVRCGGPSKAPIVLQQLVEAMGDDGLAVLGDGTPCSAGDARNLVNVHRALCERFARQGA